MDRPLSNIKLYNFSGLTEKCLQERLSELFCNQFDVSALQLKLNQYSPASITI